MQNFPLLKADCYVLRDIMDGMIIMDDIILNF